MKNNTLLLGAVGIIVLVVVGGVALFTMNKSTKPVDTEVLEEEQNIKQMSSSDVGLTLTLRSDQKAVIMKMTKLDGISSFAYEVSYDAQVVDEESGETLVVPRGAGGSEVEIKPGESTVSREVELGTCSRNVCKYDKIVGDIKFLVKINLSNGEVGSIEETVSLDQ